MADIHVGKFINNLDTEDLTSEKLQGVVNNVYAKAISTHKKKQKEVEDRTKEQEEDTVTFVKSNHDRLKAHKNKPEKDIDKDDATAKDKVAKEINESFSDLSRREKVDYVINNYKKITGKNISDVYTKNVGEDDDVPIFDQNHIDATADRMEKFLKKNGMSTREIDDFYYDLDAELVTRYNELSVRKPKRKVNESLEDIKSEWENRENMWRENILEFPSGDYVYVGIDFDKKTIYAGGATNTGIFRDTEIDLDEDDSLDGNLERLYETISEEHPEYFEINESFSLVDTTTGDQFGPYETLGVAENKARQYGGRNTRGLAILDNGARKIYRIVDGKAVLAGNIPSSFVLGEDKKISMEDAKASGEVEKKKQKMDKIAKRLDAMVAKNPDAEHTTAFKRLESEMESLSYEIEELKSGKPVTEEDCSSSKKECSTVKKFNGKKGGAEPTQVNEAVNDYIEYLGKRSNAFGYTDDDTARKELKKKFPEITDKDLDKVIKRWHTGKLSESTQVNENQDYPGRKEFMYAFRLNKHIIFEVSYYTLGSNAHADFTTAAYEFNRPKSDWKTAGQAQEELLPRFPAAYNFWKKWDKYHFHDLTDEEYADLVKDLDKLKSTYKYTERVKDTYQNLPGWESNFSFYELKKLAMNKLENESLIKETKNSRKKLKESHNLKRNVSNVGFATKELEKKGYSHEEANDLVLKIFDEHENDTTRPLEWYLDKILSKSDYNKEYGITECNKLQKKVNEDAYDDYFGDKGVDYLIGLVKDIAKKGDLKKYNLTQSEFYEVWDALKELKRNRSYDTVVDGVANFIGENSNLLLYPTKNGTHIEVNNMYESKKVEGKKLEESAKSWVLFFDKDGQHRAGSDWSTPMSVKAPLAKQRALNHKIVWPNDAEGFIVLTPDHFSGINYDELKKLYNAGGISTGKLDRSIPFTESKKLKEDWTVFEFTSGSNPYIAKTDKEVKRLLKKYKGRVEWDTYNGNYIVDDKERHGWDKPMYDPDPLPFDMKGYGEALSEESLIKESAPEESEGGAALSGFRSEELDDIFRVGAKFTLKKPMTLEVFIPDDWRYDWSEDGFTDKELEEIGRDFRQELEDSEQYDAKILDKYIVLDKLEGAKLELPAGFELTVAENIPNTQWFNGNPWFTEVVYDTKDGQIRQFYNSLPGPTFIAHNSQISKG